MASRWNGITFGIELEFMTAIPNTKPLWRVSAPEAAARLNIAELLASCTTLPIACECNHDPSDDVPCPICFDATSDTRGDRVHLVSGDIGLQLGEALRGECFLFSHEFLETGNPINAQRDWPGVEMVTPIFHSGELRSGLPTMASVLGHIRSMPLEITVDESCGMHVHVGVKTGMTLLLAQKIITMVMLVEDTVLLSLIPKSRVASHFAMPINRDAALALNKTWTTDTSVNQLQESHVPPMETMKPALWNNYVPLHFYSMFHQVWNAKTLPELARITRKNELTRVAVCVALRAPWGEAVSPRWPGDLEDTPSTVEFRYSQTTFDHKLLRNWTEVVCTIVDLAQADPGTYKTYLTNIIETQHQAEQQGKPAWEMLMKNVFDLEHRIPEWKQQLDNYKQGVVFPELDDEQLLKSE
ncbi:hypothetical protein FALBO_16370 [Fusarium albosuccineum]|uniref:Amidoligase n=1 Tax=Fusarium albosuccineum TaxID=1237068 RepID=A0A8H4KJB2_9HYPO|nr:hypothetical protein FALBO_16370 [Fusarium albosuccineum]